jgi:hypothetical protein
MKFPKKLYVLEHDDKDDKDASWLEAQSDLQRLSEEGRVAVYELVEKPRKMVIMNQLEKK